MTEESPNNEKIQILRYAQDDKTAFRRGLNLVLAGTEA